MTTGNPNPARRTVTRVKTLDSNLSCPSRLLWQTFCAMEKIHIKQLHYTKLMALINHSVLPKPNSLAARKCPITITSTPMPPFGQLSTLSSQQLQLSSTLIHVALQLGQQVPMTQLLMLTLKLTFVIQFPPSAVSLQLTELSH